MNVKIKTAFIDQECSIRLGRYGNGRLAIQLEDPDTPIAHPFA